MKLDTNRLLNRYIVLTDEARAKQTGTTNLLFGPISSIQETPLGLFLSTKDTYYGVDIYLDENGNTDDIKFITQYLWRAVLYMAETRGK